MCHAEEGSDLDVDVRWQHGGHNVLGHGRGLGDAQLEFWKLDVAGHQRIEVVGQRLTGGRKDPEKHLKRNKRRDTAIRSRPNFLALFHSHHKSSANYSKT